MGARPPLAALGWRLGSCRTILRYDMEQAEFGAFMDQPDDQQKEQQETAQEPTSEGLASLERLESRILGTIEQLREARRIQVEAEENAAAYKGQLDGKDQEIERLTSELEQARAERVDVSNRIESLLEQIDAVSGP